jgi:GTP-binding protein
MRRERKDWWLVDTAGIKPAEDDFELTIQEQIQQASDSADIILVVVEADTQITHDDRKVAKMALKSKKPVILVVNKIDRAPHSKLEDWRKLGVKTIFATSTTQKTGIDDLLEEIAVILPKSTIKQDENRIKVALLGRPNVGKSLLFNTLANKQKAVVADVAGTTRDVNKTTIVYHKQEIELMDTAGLRRSGRIERGVEHFSVLRSMAAIEDADICLLLLDVNEISTALDQKIAGMIKDAGKGLVLVISKWDSLEEKDAFTRDKLAPQIRREFDFVPWAPLIFTSSVTGQNVTKLFELIAEIHKKRQTKISTPELNRWLRHNIDNHPPAGLKNRHPKLNYIVQTEEQTPSFKIFGAHTKLLHWSYKRYLEKQLRISFGFEGTAIKMYFIEKHIDRHKIKED